MGKLKAIKPHRTFWKKLFEYAYNCGSDGVFSVITSIVVTPSLITTNDTVKYIENKVKTIDVIEEQIVSRPQFAIPHIRYLVMYLMYTAALYLQTNELKDPANVLHLMYDLIMQDYKKANYTEEDLERIEKEGKLPEVDALKAIPYDVYFYVKAVLENDKELFFLIYSIETGNYYKIVSNIEGQHAIYFDLQSETVRKQIEQHIKDFYGSDDEMFKQLNVKIDGDKAIINKDVLKLLITKSDFEYMNAVKMENLSKLLQYKENAHYKQLETYRSIIASLQNQIEELKLQLANEGKSKEKEIIYVDNSEKYELLIQDLQNELAEKEEEIQHLKKLLAMDQKAEETDYEPKSFEQPVYINYVGLKNNALENELRRYNVFINYHSPTDKNIEISNNYPTIFNISVASHAVFERIKEKHPLIVSLSNGKLLAKKIMRYLEEQIVN